MAEFFFNYEEEEIRYLVILVTTKDREEALKIAEAIISERLCACVNILENVISVFFWKGNLERASECLMVIKTQMKLLSAIIRRIKELHSYDVPEIIALPILAGNPSYLKWIEETTGNLLRE